MKRRDSHRQKGFKKSFYEKEEILTDDHVSSIDKWAIKTILTCLIVFKEKISRA